MTTYTTEVVRRIYDNDEGHFISVSPSADFPDGNVMLYVEPKEEEYMGKLRLDLPSAYMRKIGEAILAACDEADKLGR